jgi:hypothetical protein
MGCTNDIGNEREATDMAKRLIAAKTSNMITTAVNLGNFSGNYDMNLQVTDLDPGEYTIQLSPQAPGDGEGFAAYAFINWKIGGQLQPRIISVFQGASISGVCEAVDVQILDVSGGNNGVRAAPYKVVATLSRGTRPEIEQPPILVTSAPVTVGASQNSPNQLVPAGAGAVSLYATAFGIGSSPAMNNEDAVVNEIGALGAILGRYYPNISIGFNPVMPGTTLVTFSNLNGSNNIAFTFAWGIEG